MRKIYLFCFCLAVSMVASAQDSTKVVTLKEVVISASRTEQPVIEIPRSVAVIDEEEIRNSIYQSVGELLNSQGGIFVVGANQTPGTNQNIFMRGSNSNQVAVLIDGVRITDPSSPNTAIDLSEISLTNVERIEVIRGSHSTVFGGAAVGGVVNIITKRSAAEGLHGDASSQGGVTGTNAWSLAQNLNLRYGLASGLYFAGSAFRQDARGLNAAESDPRFPSFTSDRDDFRKTDFSLKAGFNDERLDANISFKRAHQYTEIDDGAFSDDENSYLTFGRNMFQYFGSYKASESLRLTLVGSVSHSERFYEDDSSEVAPGAWDKIYSTGTYHGRLQTHEMQVNYDREKFKAVVGAGMYKEKMFFDSYLFYNDPSFPFELTTNYDSLDTRTTTGYLFTTLRYNISDFNLSGGVRLSRHTSAGNFATFEFNPSYLFDDLLIYASVSTGFNAPSLYQLYDPSSGFSAYTTRGNAELKPERSFSLEAGIKKQFSSGSYLTGSVYQTSVSNSIEYVYLWNGEKEISALDYSDDRGDTYVNVGEQVVKGVEVEGFLQATPALSLQGNISLLRTQVTAVPEDVDLDHTGGHHVQLYSLGKFLSSGLDQDKLVRRPGMTAFGRVQYAATPKFTLHAAYRYTGHRFDAGYDPSLGPYGGLARLDVEAYHLVDAGINWNASQIFSFGLKIENILDEHYREVVGFQTRGRSAYLKVIARF